MNLKLDEVVQAINEVVDDILNSAKVASDETELRSHIFNNLWKLCAYVRKEE